MIELLTTEEMNRADALTVASGRPVGELMLAAGQAVRDAAAEILPEGACIYVLCGTGNNGGDGFVAARLLQESGFSVRLGMVGDPGSMGADAAAAAALWHGPVEQVSAERLGGVSLIVDALFGAGLSRDVEGSALEAVRLVNRSPARVLAVDVPSGVDGTSGEVRGEAVQADATITFFRLKPGHVLLPGRELCGRVRLAQIGIEPAVLDAIGSRTWLNRPSFWDGCFPVPGAGGHKYSRGHALITGGSTMTGAARLAARAALRTGAGLVTLGAPPAVLPIYQAALEVVIVLPMDGRGGFVDLLLDERRNVVLVGPGAGADFATRELSVLALESGRAVVLDADALTSFADEPEHLFSRIRQNRNVVMTPHEGEFIRLFKGLRGLPQSKIDRARAAAQASGSVVLLKGADTVVAAPDGRAVISDNAPPWLATAGSGDVLAGIITGLLAQGMPAFEAAAAAAWMHGEAAREVGPGLIAEDLPDALRPVLARLYGAAAKDQST
jgi:hydroxyethylthiazole kinase-like uncharacterized protein yjeF